MHGNIILWICFYEYIFKWAVSLQTPDPPYRNIKRIWLDALVCKHTLPHTCAASIAVRNDLKSSWANGMGKKLRHRSAAEPPAHRTSTPTTTQTHSFCHTHSLPLYHITLPPRGQTMNLHSERYGQRRRTGSRLRNDCSESVLVMWFVTPSALSLMWLRDGLRPAVSNEMVASDRRSRAETRKRLARLQSVTTGPGNTGLENMTTAKTLGDRGGVFTSCLCVSEWIKWSWQHLLYILSFLSLTHTRTHINLSASDTLCTILVSHIS